MKGVSGIILNTKHSGHWAATQFHYNTIVHFHVTNENNAFEHDNSRQRDTSMSKCSADHKTVPQNKIRIEIQPPIERMRCLKKVDICT